MSHPRPPPPPQERRLWRLRLAMLLQVYDVRDVGPMALTKVVTATRMAPAEKLPVRTV